MKPKPIPEGHEGATPYLICKEASRAIDFYKAAFGAEEMLRIPMPDGRVGHAELKISGAAIMLADEFPEMGAISPQTLGGTSVRMMIYVADVDAFIARAVAAGATVLQPVTDQFYGDRNCKVADPFGHVWMFGSHQEDVSREEIMKRAAALYGKK
ncbi:MAG TPA: VOC family protein [Candidatus Acidoferrales bacterium]|jgi:PhnB protein|nr:VOC family protein [Candidatus Acidoferrales bacterium]